MTDWLFGAGKNKAQRAFSSRFGLSKLLASEFLGKKTKPSVELASNHGKKGGADVASCALPCWGSTQHRSCVQPPKTGVLGYSSYTSSHSLWEYNSSGFDCGVCFHTIHPQVPLAHSTCLGWSFIIRMQKNNPGEFWSEADTSTNS